jgi:valyl-tRNA synthetase
MIFSGLYFMDEVPFKEIHIHATIQTKDGKRMSKSLGTGVDPLILIEKYGADATRFGLVYQAFGGQDIRFDENVMMMGKKFGNKLWNITRFVLTKTEGIDVCHSGLDPESIADAESRALLEKLSATTKGVEENIKEYNFGEAAHLLYDFAWHDFADLYLEYSKNSETEETKQVLRFVLAEILKLLHPFMPFITEELWNLTGHERLLLIEKWPE